MGDRVQVRDRDDEPWEKGTVKELVEGRPKVQRDGQDYASSWNQVQLLVGAQFYSLVSYAPFFMAPL